jgi:hypothetical protein
MAPKLNTHLAPAEPNAPERAAIPNVNPSLGTVGAIPVDARNTPANLEDDPDCDVDGGEDGSCEEQNSIRLS